MSSHHHVSKGCESFPPKKTKHRHHQADKTVTKQNPDRPLQGGSKVSMDATYEPEGSNLIADVTNAGMTQKRGNWGKATPPPRTLAAAPQNQLAKITRRGVLLPLVADLQIPKNLFVLFYK